MIRLQTHNPHQLNHALLNIRTFHPLVFKGLSQHLVHRKTRIQRPGGVLEHHLLVLTQLQDLTSRLTILRGGAINQDLAVSVLAELHDFQQGGSLTTPRLAHNREALALADIEGNAVNRFHGAHPLLKK